MICPWPPDGGNHGAPSSNEPPRQISGESAQRDMIQIVANRFRLPALHRRFSRSIVKGRDRLRLIPRQRLHLEHLPHPRLRPLRPPALGFAHRRCREPRRFSQLPPGQPKAIRRPVNVDGAAKTQQNPKRTTPPRRLSRLRLSPDRRLALPSSLDSSQPHPCPVLRAYTKPENETARCALQALPGSLSSSGASPRCARVHGMRADIADSVALSAKSSTLRAAKRRNPRASAPGRRPPIGPPKADRCRSENAGRPVKAPFPHTAAPTASTASQCRTRLGATDRALTSDGRDGPTG